MCPSSSLKNQPQHDTTNLIELAERDRNKSAAEAKRIFQHDTTIVTQPLSTLLATHQIYIHVNVRIV